VTSSRSADLTFSNNHCRQAPCNGRSRHVRSGSFASFRPCSVHFRSSPISGHSQGRSACLKRADIVAKVENRATRKISRKLIFGLLRRCVAFQRHCRDPWSILDEAIWSLTSPLVKRISGSKKFRSSPQKDFCNNICQQATSTVATATPVHSPNLNPIDRFSSSSSTCCARPPRARPKPSAS
jgi:hypothetical protein